VASFHFEIYSQNQSSGGAYLEWKVAHDRVTEMLVFAKEMELNERSRDPKACRRHA
jgi:hypothetical protein